MLNRAPLCKGNKPYPKLIKTVKRTGRNTEVVIHSQLNLGCLKHPGASSWVDSQPLMEGRGPCLGRFNVRCTCPCLVSSWRSGTSPGYLALTTPHSVSGLTKDARVVRKWPPHSVSFAHSPKESCLRQWRNRSAKQCMKTAEITPCRESSSLVAWLAES